MKKIFNILIMLVVLSGLFQPIKAGSVGYIITDFLVDVVATKDRIFHVRETITCNFTEERHGIIRYIPINNSVEKVAIKNLKAVGDPYSLNYSEDELKIGDPDKTIIGEKVYVIEYDLVHYADKEPDFDIFYMNLIGTRWDTTIQHAKIRINLPSKNFLSINLTDGPLYSEDTTHSNYTVNSNTIEVETFKQLDAYSGVTIMVKLPEKAFSEAKEYVPPYRILSLDYKADIKLNGYADVVETYDLQINNPESQFIRRYAYFGSTYENKLGYPSAVEYKVGDKPSRSEGTLSGLYILLNDLGENVKIVVKYEIDYDIRFPVKNLNNLLFYGRNSDEVPIDKFSAEVKMPFSVNNINLYDNVNDRKYNNETINKDFKIDYHDNTITITKDNSAIYNLIYLSYNFDDGYGFVREQAFGDIAIPVVLGLYTLLMFLIIKFLKKDVVISPVQFEPPNKLNPAEIGYLADGYVSTKEVTTLIYYWASLGYIQIKMKKKDFTLIKLKDIPTTHPHYEVKMFDELFEIGDEVTKKDLKNSFYKSIIKARDKIENNYSDMFDKTSVIIKRVMMFLFPILIFIICFIAFLTTKNTSIMVVILGFAPPTILFIFLHGFSVLVKKGVMPRFVAVISYIILIANFYFLALVLNYGRAFSILTITIMVILSIVNGFMLKRIVKISDSKRELYGLTLGFKNFLKTAEKPKLEKMLEDNPDYFYNILPYALVLGVSKIWTKKFKALLTQPPTWVDSDSTFNTAYLYTLNRSMNSFASSVSTSPSGSESGFDGGGFSGGGSSGGGFSGGGSGGGGGTSW